MTMTMYERHCQDSQVTTDTVSQDCQVLAIDLLSRYY